MKIKCPHDSKHNVFAAEVWGSDTVMVDGNGHVVSNEYYCTVCEDLAIVEYEDEN